MTSMNTDTTLPKSGLARFSGPETVNEPKSGWRFVNLRELWEYRDLFYFLVWRDIKARYAQSVLGIGWAVVQPVFTMIVFTIIFGKLATSWPRLTPMECPMLFSASPPWCHGPTFPTHLPSLREA